MNPNRLTFNTWNTFIPHWVDGLAERASLIRRSFHAPILVHPTFLPIPPSERLSILLNEPLQSSPPSHKPIPVHSLHDLETLSLHARNISSPPSTNIMQHDLILLSPFLQWTRDVPGMLVQIYQSLAEGGFFVGCFFGQDTLCEFKHVCADLDIHHHGGLCQRFLPMIHAKDAGALLQRAGFSCPTADIEHLTYHIPHVIDLIHALRNSGFNQTLITTHPSLPRTFLTDANKIYQSRYANTRGLPVSIDLIFICGWKQTQQTAFKKQHATPARLNQMDTNDG